MKFHKLNRICVFFTYFAKFCNRMQTNGPARRGDYSAEAAIFPPVAGYYSA